MFAFTMLGVLVRQPRSDWCMLGQVGRVVATASFLVAAIRIERYDPTSTVFCSFSGIHFDPANAREPGGERSCA